MRDFIQGLGLGLVLQISVGPVCIAVLHKGISEGLGRALAMVWGVALVDALYILLSVVGVSALLQIGEARMVVGIAGALLLFYFGVRYLRTPTRNEGGAVEQGSESMLRSFVFGAGLTLTNPLTILFWAGVLGGMMSTHVFDRPGGVFYFSAGCVVATLVFLSLVAMGGHLLEKVLSDRMSLWLNRAVGLFLMAFAFKLLVDLW